MTACGVCGLEVCNKNLKRHIRIKHPSRFSEFFPERLLKHKCDLCKRKFNHLKHLRFHERHAHSKGAPTTPPLKKCPLCNFCGSTVEALSHFTEVHHLNLKLDQLEFNSFDEFFDWKRKIEEETATLFVSTGGTQIKKYVCHRSGYFHSKGTGSRKLKTQGSKKINGFCPASIEVISTEGIPKIRFLSTHVGHQNDLGHITLSSTERKKLAEKIALKVPFKCIIDEMRESVNDSNLKRINLITKRDLYNIESSFNLNSDSVRHKDDATVVDTWVNEMKDNDKCILFYKPEGYTIANNTEIESGDFILIIMDDVQAEVFKKFGTECICMDSTQDVNSYGFELFTLLVIDNIKQCLPCAFLISNRQDEAIFKLFFSCISERVGKLSPNVFMSDMTDSCYNAWIEEMDIPTFRLFCSWHVDQAWRKNLVKIRNKDEQAAMYKVLRTLLEEKDQASFETMFAQTISNMTNEPKLKDFANYFVSNYSKNTKSWAYCYRLQFVVNTNIHLERVHEAITYRYLQGKRVERLDKGLHAIMKFVRDKLFDRSISSHKSKVNSKIKNIRVRHKTSEKMSFDLITKQEESWVISSSEARAPYVVRCLNVDCNCQLMCEDCDTCIHKYCCTCIDSSIKYNMCKHIHLVSLYRNKNEENPPCNSDSLHSVSETNEELFINCSDEGKNNESNTITVELSSLEEQEEINFQFKRERVKRKLLDLVNIFDNVDSHEEMDAIEQAIDSIHPKLSAIRNNITNMKLVEQPGPLN